MRISKCLALVVVRQFSSSSSCLARNISRKTRNSTSSLFVIHGDNKLGQQWVAKEPLTAGTILIDEPPAFISPMWTGLHHDTTPVCTACGLETDGQIKCSTCGWPVCGPVCEKMHVHANNECKLFANSNISYPPPSEFSASEIFSFIGLLRGGNLKRLNPVLYEEMMKLQDYKTLPRSNANTFDLAQFRCDSLSKFYPPSFKMMKEYQRIHRLSSVNAYSSDGPSPLSCGFFMVYPKVSRLNHNCSPNCTITIAPPPDLTVRIITSVDIPKGMPLTVSFNHELNQFDTRERQLAFRDVLGPGFICRCARCLDPTENGTMISGITCTACRDDQKCRGVKDPLQFGYFVPVNPLNVEDDSANWQCMRCGVFKESSSLLRIVTSLKDLLANEETEKDRDLNFYESLVRDYSGNILHPNHFLLQMIVKAIIHMLENSGDSDRQDELVQHYVYLLNIRNRIAPGINSDRVQLLVKTSTAVLSLMRNPGKDDAQRKLENQLCKNLQEDALNCVANEWPSKPPTKDHVEYLVKIRKSITKKVAKSS